MQCLTNFKTTVNGNKVTIEAELSERVFPSPMMQNTVMHSDDDNPHWITHVQISNHMVAVKIPNRPIAIGVPLEEFILNVARAINPAFCPPEKK